MKQLFFALLLLICCVTTEAQSGSDPILSQPSQDILSNNSDAYIQQIGTGNNAEINQRQRVGKEFNSAAIIQQGDNNNAIIAQRGKGNEAVVIQSGDGNNYDLLLSGRNNSIYISQQGNGNEILQRLVGFKDVNVEFIQIGDNNSIIQDLNNISAQEFKITQRGNGLSLQITTDTY